MNTAERRFKKKTKLNRLKAFDYINYTVLILFSVICLYPFWYVLIGSFNEGLDYVKGGVFFWPREITSANYVVIFSDNRLWTGLIITSFRTAIGTITALLFTAMVAYAMSRKKLKGRKIIYNLNLFTMFVGGGIIPYYLVINAIGLYDTFAVYIIPGLYSVYNMIIIQNFFKGIPEELHESCMLDGAGELRIFFLIYMPLSKPVLATVALWIAVGHWNSFFETMMFTSKTELQTLQYYLLKVIKESSYVTSGVMLPAQAIEKLSPETVSFAAIVVSVIPMVAVYPFVMKFFQSGILIGSLKG